MSHHPRGRTQRLRLSGGQRNRGAELGERERNWVVVEVGDQEVSADRGLPMDADTLMDSC